mmetsp:Transcript_22205/g.40788  ORF Transcript_22205/g.40788 Transcript_22205/m.40788 type:complete len:207 (+) Transcript_22205:295-915(+)
MNIKSSWYHTPHATHYLKCHCLKQRHSSHEIVVNHTPNSEHGQPSILELLQLQLVNILLTLVLQTVLGKTNISRNTVLVRKHGIHSNLSLIRPPFLRTRKHNYLHHGTHPNSTGHHVRVLLLNTRKHWKRDELSGDETDRGEHGDAAVFDLGLLEPLDVPHVGQAQGVEAHGADEAVGFGLVDEEGDGFGHFLGVEGGDGLWWWMT